MKKIILFIIAFLLLDSCNTVTQNTFTIADKSHGKTIYINNDADKLIQWAAKTFEPETRDIGPKTYEKIFQLLLRLKANTIWPAMHPSTQPFFTIPGNKEMAEKYHICVGTSHAEPMLRNNVREWDREKYGEFNYFVNRKRVREYWKKRVAETQDGKPMYFATLWQLIIR